MLLRPDHPGYKAVSLGLDWAFLTFLGYSCFMAMTSLLLQADARVLLWPWPNVSAYCTTVFIYAAVGVYYFEKFRWRAVVPLGLIGIVQEAAWSFGYYTLYPGFVPQAMAASTSWIDYVAAVALAAPVLVYFQRRWFRVHEGHLMLLGLGAAYMGFYYLIGMPVFFQYTGVAHTPTLLPETMFVVSSIAVYMGLVRLERRTR